jgi:hypothetical protein
MTTADLLPRARRGRLQKIEARYREHGTDPFFEFPVSCELAHGFGRANIPEYRLTDRVTATKTC